MTKEQLPPDEELEKWDKWAEQASRKVLFDYKAKLALELKEVQAKEIDRKVCHCGACTRDRMLNAYTVCEKLNHLDWVIYPERQGKRWYRVQCNDRSWEVIEVRKRDEDKDQKSYTLPKGWE